MPEPTTDAPAPASTPPEALSLLKAAGIDNRRLRQTFILYQACRIATGGHAGETGRLFDFISRRSRWAAADIDEESTGSEPT
jgi:hypothetical protein